MSVLVPYSYMYGSMSPAYDRISGLLDRTSAAFPIINGKVRLNLELTLDTMPGLSAALPAEAPVPDPPTQGGGR